MNLILNILKKVPLFQTLTEEEFAKVLEHIQMNYFPEKHSLFKEGEASGAMFILKSGSVRIFDTEKDLATLEAGDFFGEMSLIEDQPRMASAETLTECEVFVLKREDFAALMQESTEIAQKLKTSYSDRKGQNINPA